MSDVGLVGFSCTSCGKQYRWKPELAGKTVRCKCGHPVSVPKAGGGAPAAHAAPAPSAAKVRAAANAPGIAAAARSAEVPPRPPSVKQPRPAGHRMPPPPPPPPPAPKRREQYHDPFGGDDGNSGADDGGIDALAALAQQEAAAGADATATADSHFCANCRSRMSPEAVLCTNCGFDRRRGSVLAAPKVKAGPGFFGKLLGPKKQDPNKPVDKLAPQGAFIVGVGASIGLAVGAAFLWFLIAFGFGRELKFLCLLIGVGAGVGMQIGQKGYSTLGGWTAGAIALVTIFFARLAVILAVVLPILEKEHVVNRRTAAKDKAMMAVLAAPVVDGAPAEPEERRSTEDPRVVSMIQEGMYAEMKIDPRFAEFDQHEAARHRAEFRATTLPTEDKEKLIAVYEARKADEQLKDLLEREHREKMPENLRYHPTQQDAIASGAEARFNEIPPEQRKAEAERLKAKFKLADAAEAKKYAADRKAARHKALAEANDGLEGEEDMDPADALALAEDGDADGDGDEAEMDAGDEDGDAADAADGLADADADAEEEDEDGDAAVASADGDGAFEGAEDDEGSSAVVTFGLLFILSFIVFGGISGIILLCSTVFLAYRTAAGATWG